MPQADPLGKPSVIMLITAAIVALVLVALKGLGIDPHPRLIKLMAILLVLVVIVFAVRFLLSFIGRQ